MKLARLTRLGVTMAMAFGTAVCAAQDYPSRPIRFIVPQAAGGISDSITRIVAGEMQNILGQTIVVENAPGASGNIGTEKALRAEPDGYTVGAITIVQATGVATRPEMVIDVTKQSIAVVQMTNSCYTLVVPPSLGVNTLAEFIALAKSKPGKMFYGSVGSGSGHHIVAELLKASAGIDLGHVPYKGEQPAAIDLMAGRIQMMFHSTPGQYAQNKQMTMLGVTSPKPWPFLPGVPSISQTLPDVKYYGWSGLIVPLGTPAAVVEKLNAAANKALKSERVTASLTALGVEAAGGSAQDLQTQMKDDVQRFRQLVKSQNLVIE